MKTLRDYQEHAINGNGQWPGLRRALADNRSALLVMATGLGKTVVIAKWATEWPRGNVLCLAHRIELVDQMAHTLAAEIGYMPAVEQGLRGMDPNNLWSGGQIVVGSIQSMISRRRMDVYAKHPFGLVIVDESHRATSPSYAKLIHYCREINPECRVMGVTATPNRTDSTALGLVFDSVAYQMDIVDGIDQGWLVDVHQKFATCGELDLSHLKCKRNEFGEMDFKADDLNRLMSEEKVLHEMTHPVLDITRDGRQAIIFCSSVAHAHLWASVLNRPEYRPGSAAAVDGETPPEERKTLVDRFRAGNLQLLLNYGVFTEGFDAPTTSVVVMGRPTKSRLVYTQMLGRGTRALPGLVDGIDSPEGRKDAIAASVKPYLTVLDFVGASNLGLVSATDVLGGNYDVDIRERADDICGAQQDGRNVRDAITKARASIILEAEEEKRKSFVFASPGYQLHDVSAFGARPASKQIAKTRGGSTDGQIGFLVALGMKYEHAAALSKHQARGAIDKLRNSRCTDKQAKVLSRAGYDPKLYNVGSASALIDRLAANNWERV